MLHFFTLIKSRRTNDKHVLYSRCCFAAGPFVSYFYVELLNGNTSLANAELWRILWNICWYIVIYILFWLLTRRCKSGAASAASALFVIGIINHYVVRFRGRMFFPIDILSWQTVLNVAGGYNYTPDWSMLLAAVIFTIYLFLIFRNKQPSNKTSPIFTASVAGGLLIFLLVFFISGLLPAINLYPEQWQTRQNGFLFNFMLSLRYSFVSEPEHYSEEIVEEIQEEVIEETQEETAENQEVLYPPILENTPMEETSTILPQNIIIIMNESFSDLSIFENFQTNQDPLEFWHSLSENTVRGWLYSPVFGGGTANVEYEVLTGCPCAFLPEGTIAYQLFVDNTTPSLAALANEHGYTSYAFHPYLSSGWNRTQAYQYLGFDHQLYDEDVESPAYVREYISDACDFNVIRQITEKEEGKTFIFNVTMQNHSGYGLEWTNLPHNICLTGGLENMETTAEQYLCLLDCTDRAFEDLLAYYSSSDEPTLIAMFGDHQPPLETDFYDILYGNTAEMRSHYDDLLQYRTPFVIWANYDIKEQQDISISANYFGLLTSDIAGLERTYFMEMLADTMNELPIIHNLGYMTSDGNFAENESELTELQKSLLQDYQIISYHDLFDREENDEFYEVPQEASFP